MPGTDRRVRWLHELYTIADPTCTTRVTVPTLWDAKTRRVVNNESSEIMRMFNTAFSGIATASPDYYPEPLRPEIDATNALVLKGVNNAVNGCGYSISQEAYDSSVKLSVRDAGLHRRTAFAATLLVRRRRNRSRLEAVSKSGTFRSLLLRRIQMQPASP